MARKNSILYAIPISAILLLEVGMPARLSSIAPAAAQNANSQVLGGTWNEFEPPGNGSPGRREPGGTRGPKDEVSLTALMPAKNASLTISPYPSFLFYLPEISSQTAVEFVLYEYVDEKTDKEVYKTTFTTTGKSGIVSINLPDTANLKPLEIGKNYHWYFSVIVNPKDRSQDKVAEGWVKRIDKTANLENELKNASGLNVAKAYKKALLWQDTIATLADLRRKNPSDLTIVDEWNKVLTSVGLEKIAQAPIIEKIAVQNQ
jgi:hypothetical protein